MRAFLITVGENEYVYSTATALMNDLKPLLEEIEDAMDNQAVQLETLAECTMMIEAVNVEISASKAQEEKRIGF